MDFFNNTFFFFFLSGNKKLQTKWLIYRTRAIKSILISAIKLCKSIVSAVSVRVRLENLRETLNARNNREILFNLNSYRYEQAQN